MAPVLPLDLEREIFETAAIRNPKLIPTLLRVCHRVHEWVEPLLYQVLFIRSSEARCLLAVQSKSQAFLERSVRHVFFPPRLRNDIKNVLESPRITSLFINGDLSSDLLPFLEKLRPRKLYFSIPDLAANWAKSTLDHAVFQSVTHLELYWDSWESRKVRWDEGWSRLSTLPALTHLCLSQLLSEDLLGSVLAECRQLIVVITCFWAPGEDADRAPDFAQQLTITDPRIVVMAVMDCTADWTRGAQGGEDFWARAEMFIARKRRGEIESTCYYLDESATRC